MNDDRKPSSRDEQLRRIRAIKTKMSHSEIVSLRDYRTATEIEKELQRRIQCSKPS